MVHVEIGIWNGEKEGVTRKGTVREQVIWFSILVLGRLIVKEILSLLIKKDDDSKKQAVLLIKSVYSVLHKQGKKMLAVFLVPKVLLVYQEVYLLQEMFLFYFLFFNLQLEFYSFCYPNHMCSKQKLSESRLVTK